LYFIDSFQKYSSNDDYNSSSALAISKTSPGIIYFILNFNITYFIIFKLIFLINIGSIERTNIILESPKHKKHVIVYLGTYESLTSSWQLLLNGSNLNIFSKYKALFCHLLITIQ